jgi:hypothetical protein
VLDVDSRPDGDGWAGLNQIKRAGLLAGARALVRTRSGGLHIYFDGTDQPCGRLRRHHIDLKAAGGYVLAPPSFVEPDGNGPAGQYEVLDHRSGGDRIDWAAVRQLLDPPRRRPLNADPGTAHTDRLIGWVERQSSPGDRHGPVLWAAFRLFEAGVLDDAVADELVAASVKAGHDERDAFATVRSVQRRAVPR